MKIRTAINNKDVDSLAKLVGSSLSIREQHWQATETHSEPLLITASDSKILNQPKQLKGLELLATSLFIQSEDASVIKNNKELFAKELLGVEHNWTGLEIVGFTRQRKGIEQRVLFGFDPSTKKLLAVYRH